MAQRLIDAQERVIKEINKVKTYDKTRFDKGRNDSTFEKGDIVWLEQEGAPGDQTKKFMAKYIGPYSITKLIAGGHDLNVEVTHVNNPNDIRIVNIRKLKRAILRPEQVEIIAKEIEHPVNMPPETESTPQSKASDIKPEFSQAARNPKNLKGRTAKTQALRAGITKKAENNQETYVVEDITSEKTTQVEGKPVTKYLVKWEGYPSSANTWQTGEKA